MESLRFVEFIDAACSRLGAFLRGLCQLRVTDIQLSWSPEAVVKERLPASFRGRPNLREPPSQSRDGSVRDMELSYRAIDPYGRCYLAGVWRDITERRQVAEQLLKPSPPWSKAPAVIVTDPTGVTEYVNEASSRDRAIPEEHPRRRTGF